VNEKDYGLQLKRDGKIIGELWFSTLAEAKMGYWKVTTDPLYVELRVEALILEPAPEGKRQEVKVIEPLVAFVGY
jgi:hypothetical protein